MTTDGKAARLQTRVRAMLRSYKHVPDPQLSVSLFQALGWDSGAYGLELNSPPRDADSYQLTVAGQPAALLYIDSGGPDDATLGNASNLAYNSGVDWVAVTNFGRLQVANPRWWKRPVLVDLTADEYTERITDLELLSPESIVSGRLAERARSQDNDRGELVSIDEQLLQQLQSWRRLVLSMSPSVTDLQIHELLGRLLFIRSCEDRKIIGGNTLLNLQSEAGAQESLGKALNRLFAALSKQFDSELFPDNIEQLPVFDDAALSRVLRELYFPYSGLTQYRYDFAYMERDVLGEVYQRYVATVMERVPPPSKSPVGLFDDIDPQPVELQTRSMRRAQGVFYTPPFMVNYIVQHALERLFEARPAHIDDFPLIADISCGSGAFLTRAVSRMAARAQYLNGGFTQANGIRHLIDRVAGVDSDPRAVALAKVNLWILATTGEPPSPLPNLEFTIKTADALFAPELDTLEGQFDAVVGNPPFRSSTSLDRTSRDSLGERYVSASGKFDIAYVFVERALRLVKPGGVLGLVIPNRLFTSTDARFLRELLAASATMETVVDFGSSTPFEQGKSYVAILICRKNLLVPDNSSDIAISALNDEGKAKRAVDVHRVLKLSPYPGLQLRRADLQLSEGDGEDGEFSTVFRAPQPRGGGPWIWWASGREDRVQRKLQAGAVPLGEIADIRRGVNTGNDDVFIVRQETITETGGWLVRNNVDNRTHEIEPGILRACVRGRMGTIDRYAVRHELAREYVIYPYLNESLLDETEFESVFPLAFAYLSQYREALARRKTITRTRGRAWYDLNWSRVGDWLESPKLLTRQLVPQASFAVDWHGVYAPVSGWAVLPRTGNRVDLSLLLGVLNSSVATWYFTRHANAFQGGSLELTKAELKKFPFPIELIEAEPMLGERIGFLATDAARSAAVGLPFSRATDEIDRMLFGLLGLDSDERELIATAGQSAQGKADARGTLFEDLPSQPAARLQLAQRLLGTARQATTAEEYQRALIGARDELLAAINEGGAAKRGPSAGLLAFGIIATEQLLAAPFHDERLILVAELVASADSETLNSKTIAEFERRLRDVGIDVLPGMARASLVVAASADDEEFADGGGFLPVRPE